MARSQGGLGLGLALVKGLVELHSGAVIVASAGKGKGSEFIVQLPIRTQREILKAQLKETYSSISENWVGICGISNFY